MNKFADNRMTIAVFLGLTSLLGFILFSSSLEVELLAQQQGTISIARATALPLVNSEGNQVKVVINYSMGSDSLLGQKVNAVMGIYDRINGTLIKLSSFPDGFILNNTAGTVQLASTLTDPKIQNISTIITITNADKSEKYSNDVRSDLDLTAVLPTSLPALNGTLPLALPPSAPSSAENGGNQQDDDNSSSNSDDE
jgi:hypothetical protein